MQVMTVDHIHDCMSLKRVLDGSWQLWCGCGTICTGTTVSKVTRAHQDHIIRTHLAEVYGEDK